MSLLCNKPFHTTGLKLSHLKTKVEVTDASGLILAISDPTFKLSAPIKFEEKKITTILEFLKLLEF